MMVFAIGCVNDCGKLINSVLPYCALFDFLFFKIEQNYKGLIRSNFEIFKTPLFVLF